MSNHDLSYRPGQSIHVHTDKYDVVNVDFTVRVADREKENMSPSKLSEYLLNKAVHGLAAQLLEMDDIFTIDTDYRIDTLELRVNHRIKVLKEN